MTATWDRVQGDIDDTVVVTLGGVADLGGVTAVQAHVALATSAGTGTDLDAVVDDPDERTVIVDLSPWLETAEPGTWHLEVQTVWASGETITFPEGRKPTINVTRQLG